MRAGRRARSEKAAGERRGGGVPELERRVAPSHPVELYAHGAQTQLRSGSGRSSTKALRWLVHLNLPSLLLCDSISRLWQGDCEKPVLELSRDLIGLNLVGDGDRPLERPV